MDQTRVLVEFDEYSAYFGARLYPRVGKLALAGLAFLAGFGVLDWFLTRGQPPFWTMQLCRLGAGLLLAAAGLHLVFRGQGWGPARATLVLGVLSFLLISVNYTVLTIRLDIVAFSWVFYLLGILTLAPLLRLRDYAIASVVALVAMGSLMEVNNLKAADYAAVGLFAVPTQLFLGAALVAAQKAAEDHYNLARQNFLLSALDSLTQLLNRRTWYQQTQDCLRRQGSRGQVSFLMVDIDHFKRFNDQWGHDCGDEVIRKVAAQLLSQTRQDDVVGRLGGEEFGIFLADASLEGARETAERIRQAVEAEPVVHRGQSLSVTVSLGVASTVAGAIELEALIRNGDQALYRAKKAGRNRVET